MEMGPWTEAQWEALLLACEFLDILIFVEQCCIGFPTVIINNKNF